MDSLPTSVTSSVTDRPNQNRQNTLSVDAAVSRQRDEDDDDDDDGGGGGGGGDVLDVTSVEQVRRLHVT